MPKGCLLEKHFNLLNLNISCGERESLCVCCETEEQFSVLMAGQMLTRNKVPKLIKQFTLSFESRACCAVQQDTEVRYGLDKRISKILFDLFLRWSVMQKCDPSYEHTHFPTIIHIKRFTKLVPKG